METNITIVAETAENINLGEITRIEYKGQLVLTTEQLATFYGTKIANIVNNFHNNKTRFIEGKHYFKLEGNELVAFKNNIKNFDVIEVKAKKALYLWTKRGAARHCKSVGTNEAWDVFELLEDNYFDKVHRQIDDVTDFERGEALSRLAMSARDPFTKKRLVAKAANLILGEEFIPVPVSYTEPKVQLTLF